MQKISDFITKFVGWFDAFEVKVFRWYLKLKTVFKVLMFLPIALLVLLSKAVLFTLIFTYDTVCLVLAAVTDVKEHLQQAKVFNDYVEADCKSISEVMEAVNKES